MLKKKTPTSIKEGGGSMEILTFLVSNSDAIFLSILGAYIYDKIKNHSNCRKSDSN